jgi:hypothetical protein
MKTRSRFVVLAVSGSMAAIGISACAKKAEPTLHLLAHSMGNSSLSDLRSAGDQLSFHEQLTRNGQSYGTDDGGCIADTDTTANCALTLSLPGGTIVLQGRVRVASDTTMLHVSQGTGKYVETSGVADAHQHAGNERQLTLHLKPY